jgi:putative ABC transport system permease protein
MLLEIIREAWVALKRNYTRTFLTMLGIVWGIATVTLLIAYGNSFRKILVGGFDAFGKSVVICWPQQTSEQPGAQSAGRQTRCAVFVRNTARCETRFHPRAAG